MLSHVPQPRAASVGHGKASHRVWVGALKANKVTVLFTYSFGFYVGKVRRLDRWLSLRCHVNRGRRELRFWRTRSSRITEQ